MFACCIAYVIVTDWLVYLAVGLFGFFDLGWCFVGLFAS